MTFPGVQGVQGPGWLSSVGFPVRQSRAGAYPGGESFVSVLDSMGSNAPAWGVAAQNVTVMQEMAADPHQIEAENFELDFDQQGVYTADTGSPQDYTGRGRAGNVLPIKLPGTF